jgi:peroxiredoxin
MSTTITTPTLASTLAATKANFNAHAPAPIVSTINHANAEFAKVFDPTSTIKVGDTLPSFTLPSALNQPISSTTLLRSGPLLLTFYRGSWCPYCNLALHALQAILPALTAKGVTLVAITPEVPSEALSTAEKNALAFPVLSDIGNIYAAQLGILFPMPDEMKSVFDGGGIDLKNRNGDESLVVPVPATILVGRDGIVKKVFIEADYSMRLEPSVALEWIDEMLEG